MLGGQPRLRPDLPRAVQARPGRLIVADIIAPVLHRARRDRRAGPAGLRCRQVGGQLPVGERRARRERLLGEYPQRAAVGDEMVDGQADRRRAGRQGEDPGPDQRPLLQIERSLDQAPQCRIQLLRVRHRCGADRRAVPPGQLQAIRVAQHMDTPLGELLTPYQIQLMRQGANGRTRRGT